MDVAVTPQIAAMSAELSEAWDLILAKYAPHLAHHEALGLSIITAGGVVARFYEEGIVFYPKDEKEEKENN